MKQSYGGFHSSHCRSAIFGFSVLGFVLWTLAGSTVAQTSTQDSSGIVRGKTEQGFAYMTGGVGSSEREKMKSWAGDYNLKLAFAEASGMYVSDVVVSIEKDGRQLVRTTTDGPWFYIKLPPGRYIAKATYEGETKQITNIQLTEDDRVSRVVHWNLDAQARERSIAG